MRSDFFGWTRLGACLLCGVFLLAFPGCVGTLANLIRAGGGGMIPAAYEGLRDQRVAVVCVSNAQFGPPATSQELGTRVARLLEKKVDKIDLIKPQQVDDWIDRVGWDYINHITLGKGLDADKVVAIDLDSFSLREGGTLFQGRADIRAVVYDVASESEVFTYQPPQVQYPSMGVPSTGMSEQEFRRHFLSLVAERIARNFYSYNGEDDYARDAAILMR